MSGPVRKKVLQTPRLLEFKIPCAFNGQMSDVAVYLGNPEGKHNPIFFQNKFINDVKGGMISPAVLESLDKLKTLALENGVDFLDLCKDALTSLANTNNSLIENQQEAAAVEEIEKNEAVKMISNEDNQQPLDNDAPTETAPAAEVTGEEKLLDSEISDVIAKVVEVAEDPTPAENRPETELENNTISTVLSNENTGQSEEKPLEPEVLDVIAKVVKDSTEADPPIKEEETADLTISEVVAKVVQAAEETTPPKNNTSPEKDSIINPNNEDG
jgi:hypothetical protein